MGTTGLGAMTKRAYDLLSAPLLAGMTLSRRLRLPVIGEERAYLEQSERAARWTGVRGERARRLLHVRLGTPVGEGTTLRFGCVLERPPLRIGARTVVGHYANLQHASVGHDCLIGDYVLVVDGARQHSFERTDIPISQQGGQVRQASIGDDCLIGGHSVILADVGDHCIVGAGSVVVHPVPDYKIVAGNPARVIGDRRETEGP